MKFHGLVLVAFLLLAAFTPLYVSAQSNASAVYLHGTAQQVDEHNRFFDALENAPNPSKKRVQMSWDGWVCLAIVLCVMAGLFLEAMSCTAMMFTATLILLLCQVIDRTMYLSGLSNYGVITIAHLFIVVDPIAQLPLVKIAVVKILQFGGANSLYMVRLKLCLLAIVLSAFANQNPIVVMMTPIVKQFCRDHNYSPAQLLMPMAYASAFGGSWTVIGTSVNLVYDGLMVANHLGHMSFFELIKTTIVPTIVGVVYLVFVPSFLLPHDAGGMFKLMRDKSSNFLAQFVVQSSSPLIDVCVSEMNALMPPELLSEVNLIEIVRKDDETVMAPPRPHDRFCESDLLVFSGPVAVLKTYAKLLHLEWVPNTADVGNVMCVESFVQPPTEMAAANNAPAAEQQQKTPATPVVANDSFTQGRRMRAQSIRDTHSKPTSTPTVVSTETHNKLPIYQDLSHASFGRNLHVAAATEGVAVDEVPDFVEIVIGFRSPTVGTTVGSGVFQKRYAASILAIRPADGANDITTSSKMSETVIQVSDTLLVFGPPSFGDRFSREFSLVSTSKKADDDVKKVIAQHYIYVPWWFPIGSVIQEEVVKDGKTNTGADFAAADAIPPNRKEKVIKIPTWYRYLSLLIFAVMVAFTIAGFDIFVTSAIAVVATVGFKMLTVREAVNAVDLNVMIMIAYSFGLGQAMTNSSLAAVIGQGLADAHVTGFKLLLLLAAVTCIVTNAITNKACAQVLFPIVLSVYKAAGKDPLPAIMVLCASSSWAFSTSYGKPTNLIILGPGGYHSKDYAKLGVPLNIIMIPLVAVMASIVYGDW